MVYLLVAVRCFSFGFSFGFGLAASSRSSLAGKVSGRW
jgi:hypothetical protein